jgi:hydrogenase maturation protein HypF
LAGRYQLVAPVGDDFSAGKWHHAFDSEGEEEVGVGGSLIRRRLVCRGVVQGAGFRPAIHRLADALGLAGFVRNDPEGATVEVEGPEGAVSAFERRLPGELPLLARLDAVTTVAVPARGERAFRSGPSRQGPRRSALIPPDAALCRVCRAEMESPGDRRHRYAFTSCTDCGPRYSLVRSLPYDRERTSMACFPLCAECRTEYERPESRRFGAEPICCPRCGPRLWLTHADGQSRAEGESALAAARAALAAGLIVAVKGLGGFQLACVAEDAAVVKRLRERKRRPTKPFAVMVRGVEEALRCVVLEPEAERLLASPEAPIVLAPRASGCSLSEEIAPGLSDLGILLPTTPLHVELFRGTPFGALVMTSGNASDEPICRGNREALERLGSIADVFLLHDRDVVRRVDDSVARAEAGGVFAVRRSRGAVPRRLSLPDVAPEPVLALGGHLQATACVAIGGDAFPSQHVGDLDTESARDFLVEVAHGLEEFLEVEAAVFACDLHPDYPSTWIADRLAATRGGRVMRVQHHLAHAAAVLGEHQVFPAEGERAAALILDGMGWGVDGTAWGGEVLLLEGDLRWRRLGHGTPLPLVGGETAIREPWRVAAAALAMEGEAPLLSALPMADRVDRVRMAQVVELAADADWPRATGAGRLFEAAGAMLGLAVENGWEGEAAARLESLAASADGAEPWPEVVLPADAAELPTAALLAAVARRAIAGESPAQVAAGVHATFAHLAARLVAEVVPDDVTVLALAGGCLVNRLLRRDLAREIAALGLRPLLPRELPAGDGGLASGQAVLAVVSLARGRDLQWVPEGGA